MSMRIAVSMKSSVHRQVGVARGSSLGISGFPCIGSLVWLVRIGAIGSSALVMAS